MELVSKSSTSVTQVVKTMHPQGNSASLSQQSHMPQSLSNIHTSPSAAHNYANQHPSFSLTVSSMNQNSDQAPTSNHPIAGPAIGQSYNLQKSNNAAPVQNSQTHTQAPLQQIANVAPQVAEQPLPEKSQANGTSEGEPSQKPAPQSEYFLTSKDKPSAQTAASVQVMEIDPLSVQEASFLPIPAKADNSGSSKLSPDVSTIKSTKELLAPKLADSAHFCSTIAAQPETETASEKEQDPLYLPEKDGSDAPHQINKSESKLDINKQKELNVESVLRKNIKAAAIDAAKATTSIDHVKEERLIQKETKTVKATQRKIKTVSSQEHERPMAGTSASSSGIGAAKRQRIRTQHYQSPLPEVEFVSKISSTSMRNIDEKLIVFYKHEFLAVRNAEGGFYLCQATQNIYKSSPKIKIRWLSQVKIAELGEVYAPDFYDLIDFDCILTNLSLTKADKGKFILPPSEKARTESILNRSLAVEKGEEISSPSLTEEHPDGLDLSLYRDEDQLKKRKRRKRSRKAPPTSASKQTATKKSPKVSKVRKVSPVVKEAAKSVAPKKPAKPTKKSVTAPVVTKPIVNPPNPKSSRVSGKVNNKTNAKTSLVDQKKAKVLARIGRKAAPTAATKSPKNNSKNVKPGNKAVGSSIKTTVQPRASSNGSVKTATTRSVRKSTRK